MNIKPKILEQINKYGVSVVIGARNEFPNVALTIGNIAENLHASGITKWEIILQDNGSTDDTSRFFAWKPISKGTGHNYPWLGSRWAYQYSPRGLVNEDRLRIFFDPVLSNVGTRNKGVLNSRYKYIVFSDAHMSFRHNAFYYILESLITYGGIIHGAVSWLGASPDNPQAGLQYSYKVGEKIWGTWNRTQVSEQPFYIPLCGHCFLAVEKTDFLKRRGYPYAQRVYGGGEPYLDTKWWMTGSTSMMDPRALVFHLSAGRGYSWDNADLIFNMLLVSYILGGNEWIDRIYITYLNKGGVNKSFLTHLYETAKAEGQGDKDWLDENKIMEFEELLGLDKEHLIEDGIDPTVHEWYCTKCTKRGTPEPHVMREWDRRNDGLHGNHRSYVQEFRLRKDGDSVYIGNTKITDDNALEIAKRYL